MLAARTLLFESSETVDDSLLLAKVSQGSRALLFSIDRDNYEFILRMPGGRRHIAWGFLSSEFKGVSITDLEHMMTAYIIDGVPLRIPGHLSAPVAKERHIWTLHDADTLI